MRGRLVVAGSLDHLPDERVAHEVVIRMKMTVPRGDGRSRTVGRKVMDYRLPAGVSPQNMTLRWLLTERESRLVDRAGDRARVSVVVRESRAAGPMITYLKVADRLRLEPLTTPPSYGSAPRSTAGTVFIPAGFYQVNFPGNLQVPPGPYYVATSEDPSGAPFIWGVGNAGVSPDYWEEWSLSPTWIIYQDTGNPGPGDGYIYMNGSVPTWSFDDTFLVQYGCPTYRVSGSFTNGAVAMSWTGAVCGLSQLPIGDGSVTGMKPKS